MTMENPGHEGTKPAADYAQRSVAGSVRNPSRRRFTRAGVGASAVVMTLASRSVLANMACTTASGFHSANLSHTGSAGDSAIQCNGLSYQDWMNTADWHPPKTMSFTDAFGTVPRDDLIVGAPVPATVGPASKNSGNKVANTSDTLKLKEATLHQAMFGAQTPLIIKHLIAALLNASSGKSTNPNIESVKAIFMDWNTNNSYGVTAGLRWSTDDIIEYLQYTQTNGPITFPPKRS